MRVINYKKEISQEPAVNKKLLKLFKVYRQHCTLRSERLFLEFLPTGYHKTTLSSVNKEYLSKTVYAKVHLGMLITLYDDFADNPNYSNPELLEVLYKIPFEKQNRDCGVFYKHEESAIILAGYLVSSLYDILKSLPNYDTFIKIFKFDLMQFFQANRYSQLLTEYPYLMNGYENKHIIHHNMGMIAAGMIDLMASGLVDIKEMGAIRGVLNYGQRIGRICNVLNTVDREIEEGDVTNELINMASYKDYKKNEFSLRNIDLTIPKALLSNERDKLYSELEKTIPTISTFDVSKYIDGLHHLQTLHEKLKGVI